MEKIKLNLGGGPKRIQGFLNVDALAWNGATDVVHDLTKFPYPWEEGSVSEITMVELLEHISFRYTSQILAECYRILGPGGKLHIQVPNIKEMIDCYVYNQICECVPHKPVNKLDAMARQDCFNCKGRGRVHPNRWLYAFCGAQKHEYDFHRNIFTPESLEEHLLNAGFSKIDMGRDDYSWKIKCNCYK